MSGWVKSILIKYVIATFLFAFGKFSPVISQNLVINPGFEIYTDSSVVQYKSSLKFYGNLYSNEIFSNSPGWSSATSGTPDLYSFRNTDFSNNGYSIAHACVSGYNWEYVQGSLIIELKPDRKYLVQINIAATIGSKSIPASVGIKFTTDEQNIFGVNCLNSDPDIEWTDEVELPSATNTWVVLIDTFVSRGGEKYFHIGNFRPDKSIKKILLDKNGLGVSCLFIDDVSIQPIIPDTNEILIKNLEALGINNTLPLENIYFEKSSYELDMKSWPILDLLTAWLISNPMINIMVEGHTDKDGSEAYNLELSYKRAESIKQYLCSKGIASSRIKTKGYGESLAASEDTSEISKKQNRRIELRRTK